MWKEEVLFFDGDTYYYDVIQKITAAKKSILFECYIFNVDRVGKKILEVLAGAAEKINVQLMVDGIGSSPSVPTLQKFCQTNGIKFNVYHRIRFPLDFFNGINKRNHRKTVIIDSEAAFVGSYNISEVHSKTYNGKEAWSDAAVYVKGKAVSIMETAFYYAWNNNSGLFSTKHDDLVLLNSNIRLRYSLYQRFNLRLKKATKRIHIANAYFLPRRTEMKSLMNAAKRKVFVGLCLPKKSDVWIIQAISQLFYPKLLKAGVRIYEYLPTILHSKTIIIDDWAAVGSHNFNHRSFIHDLEIQVVLTHPKNIKLLEEQWKNDIEDSTEIKIDHLPFINILKRILVTCGYWFRYWL